MFHDLWREIEAAEDKKLPRVVAKVAEEYDDMMLSYEIVPDEAVDLLVRVFSFEPILNTKGLEHFLLEINVDLCKYTNAQRAKLFNALIENAKYVKDELSRHSIGDFIARAFPSELALATFLALSEGTASEKHVAFVGIDVLRMRVPKDSVLYKKIIRKWSEMLNAK
jgi:hypothetical protein